MNYLICYSECRHLLREKLLPIGLGVVVLLTLFAFYNGYAWSTQQQRVIAEAELEQQQMMARGEAAIATRKNLSSPINWWDDVNDLRGYAFYLMVDYAIKPPQPLAPVAVGQSDILPYFFRMSVDKRQGFIHQHETLHPLLLYLGRFDLAFFTIYILPLLIIAMNFSALALEKQSGQLRLLMLQGVSPLRLVLNQLAVRSGLIVLPFIVLVAVLLSVSQQAMIVSQLLELMAVILVYAFFWVALSAWIISKGKTAAFNATSLIAIWLVVVVLIPAALNTWIAWSNPGPSRVHYVDTLRDETDKIAKSSAKTLAAYFQDHPELAKAKPTGQQVAYAVKKLATINAIEQAMMPLERAFTENLNQQQQAAQRLTLLSPATMLQSALYRLAGNGLHRHQDFMQQVLGHHQALRDFFQTRIVAASQRGDFNPCDGCNARITFTEFSTMPRFEYQPVSVASVLPMMSPLVIVTVWLMGFAVFRLQKMNSAQQSGEVV